MFHVEDRAKTFLVTAERVQSIPSVNPLGLDAITCLQQAVRDVPGVFSVEIEPSSLFHCITVERSDGVKWDHLAPKIDEAIGRCTSSRTFTPQSVDSDGEEIFFV